MRHPSLALLSVAAALTSFAGSQTPLTTVRVATGLDAPVYVTAAPGDDRRLFVLEQNLGNVRVVRDGQLLSTPFLNLRARISFGGERGLLGLAFHPSYRTNGLFFVSYTDGNGDSIIARYRVSSNPDLADGNSWQQVLKVSQPDANHNGGCIQFGPDGYLYIGFGDGGSQGDPNCNAQRGDSLLGKMLRLDIDRGTPYAIPPSNPFVGDTSVLDEIWSIGFRNPWRFSFDKLTGDMFIGDVGQQRLEEISFQPGTSVGGENYGWKIREGNLCYNNILCPGGVPACSWNGLVDPIHVYSTNCSVIGGFVYRGCAIPDLRGTYFFGDFCTAKIWSFRYNGQVSNFADRTSQLQPQGGWIGNVTSFGQDNCGEVYIVDYTGSVYKIVAAGPPAADDLGFGTVGSNGRVPHFDVCGRLETGNTAQLRLRDGQASAPAAMLVGLQMNPTSFQNGMLVPIPILTTFALATNQDGAVEFTLPGGGGPVSIYAQYVLLDNGVPSRLGISNALRINFR